VPEGNEMAEQGQAAQRRGEMHDAAHADEAAPRILIVDDDPILGQVVSRYLQRHGMQTQWVGDGERAVAAVQRQVPDLVLLDVMLPGRGGHAVCRDLREQWDLPVLMLTALGDAEARVAGLESGADDYVAKPFSPRELVLRIRALLRRSRTRPSRVPDLLRDGRLSLDLSRRQAVLDQRPLPLTAREHDLLAFLMQHPHVALTRQQLLERVWGWSHGELSTVTVHDPGQPQRLQTVFGVGYRYEYGEQQP
jgi:DNA-binding response OmpR family regulator